MVYTLKKNFNRRRGVNFHSMPKKRKENGFEKSSNKIRDKQSAKTENQNPNLTLFRQSLGGGENARLRRIGERDVH